MHVGRRLSLADTLDSSLEIWTTRRGSARSRNTCNFISRETLKRAQGGVSGHVYCGMVSSRNGRAEVTSQEPRHSEVTIGIKHVTGT